MTVPEGVVAGQTFQVQLPACRAYYGCTFYCYTYSGHKGLPGLYLLWLYLAGATARRASGGGGEQGREPGAPSPADSGEWHRIWSAYELQLRPVHYLHWSLISRPPPPPPLRDSVRTPSLGSNAAGGPSPVNQQWRTVNSLCYVCLAAIVYVIFTLHGTPRRWFSFPGGLASVCYATS